ncbi:MAG: hypothetical protein OXF93_19985 [Acidobacteria bacterium]|nr:hypothetical protein [Acidobacteriota bacterium]
MTTRERLAGLDRECVNVCVRYRYLSPHGNPNVFLVYSTPETFEPPTSVMWLGKNPGGGVIGGDQHPHDSPFTAQPGWSAYLDLRWGAYPPGHHPMQRAVLDTAALLAGRGNDGEALLRSSPAANLSPYRSLKWQDLPAPLRSIEVGIELIRVALPRTLVLLFSDRFLWSRLLRDLGRNGRTQEFCVSKGAGFTLRESVEPGGTPEYVFALPGVNTRTTGHNGKVLDLLHTRITAHGLADW